MTGREEAPGPPGAPDERVSRPGSRSEVRTNRQSPRSAQPSPANHLAAALRQVTEVLVGRRVPEEALAAAAEQVSVLAEHLAAVAAPGKAPRGVPDRRLPPQDYFDTSPVIGFANPLAPPAEVWVVDGEGDQEELRGTVTFGYAHEGPPTCVHGGVIAELFDELLGTTNILTGHAGMTGTLSIRYRRPTPILVPLELEARLEKVEGRKISVVGAIRRDGEVTAEAHGLFIEAPPSRMLQVAAAHAAAAGEEVVDEAMASAMEQAAQMARSRPSQ
jgi:acyl-coenzyme A thioesterase PaaI-like protein